MKSFLLLSLLLLLGCASSNTDMTAVREFSKGGGSASSFVNTLGPADVVKFSVEVNGLPQVSSTSVELNEDGIGTFPLVGDLELAGLSRAEAKTKVEKAYRSLYVNPPMISFSVLYQDEAETWGFVTVLGRVNNPGRVAISSPEGIYLSEALREAGGFALGAKRDGVKVTRPDEQGGKLEAVIDFERIAESGEIDSDVELKSGDLVFVPERLF